MNLNNLSILITGGTGSFGKEFIKTVVTNFSPKKIIVYSRDELKQFEMQKEWPVEEESPFRYFLGDVRDLSRLKMAMEGADIVIHAAALKQVPAAEYNPFEVVKTNILGAQNVIEAALANQVSKVIALSTDKAAAPINLYGATKLTSDKLFVAGNNYSSMDKTRFSVVRYGNVMGSRGSVIPFFYEKKDTGVLPITHKKMTRFNITLKEGVEFVLDSLSRMWGGEIFVPKIPSYNILDLAEAIAPEAKIEEVGIRPGEKLNEEMITVTDSLSTIEFKNHYVILPTLNLWDTDDFKEKDKEDLGTFCPNDFCYNSGTNEHFLKVNQLRKLIREHLNLDI
jgi:UDP-N-acetylglucosamine 4,6-dehydratase (inverting)